MTRRTLVATLACVAALAAAASLSLAEPRPAQAATPTPTLVSTIDQPYWTEFFARAGTYLLFAVQHGSGQPGELWRTDGTSAGTQLVESFAPGMLSDFVSLGDRAIFESADGTLWRSDGTAAGTVQISQVSEFTSPQNLTVAGDAVYFSAEESGVGRQPWRTDGTAGGTARLAVIDPGGFGQASGFVQLGGDVYFNGSSADGTELWRSDGIPGGTTEEVADINPGGDSDPRFLTLLGDHVYFSADDGTNGRRLWAADANGASLVSPDVSDPGVASGNWWIPFATMGGKLYFPGTDATHGTELWESDGTASGTQLVADINPTGNSTPGNYSGIAVAGNTLYFNATDRSHGLELWKSDGVPGGVTQLVTDTYPANASDDNYPYVLGSLTAVGADAVFAAWRPDDTGTTIYRTDGTTTTDVLALTGDPSDAPWVCGNNTTSSGCEFTQLGDSYYFTANTSTGMQIWRYGPPAASGGATSSGPESSGSSPTPGEAAVSASAGGTLVAADSAAALTWEPGTFASDVTLVAKPVTTAGVAAIAGGSTVVSITATDSSGRPVTTLAKPLVIHFPAGFAGAVPASSSDGFAWTPMPLLESPALPDGQRDGYFVRADGSVDVYTRHLTLFGLFADTQAPKLTTFAGSFSKGSLVLRWAPATDNGRIARYEIELDGRPLLSVAGDATSASVRAFHPRGRTAYAVVAIDAAGNRSEPATPLTVEPKARPKAVPARIPAWAFALQRWQARRAGPRPAAAPKRLPAWYPAWAAWRAEPFRIVA
jgi:ELWxxDGT repeat protein